MTRLSPLRKNMAMVIGIIALLASIAVPAFTGMQIRAAQSKALSNAKQICLACMQYAIDHGGNYPPSLDTLFPTYLADRSVLPAGFIYTAGLKETSPPDTVVIKYESARPRYNEIEVRVDGSAHVSKVP